MERHHRSLAWLTGRGNQGQLLQRERGREVVAWRSRPRFKERSSGAHVGPPTAFHVKHPPSGGPCLWAEGHVRPGSSPADHVALPHGTVRYDPPETLRPTQHAEPRVNAPATREWHTEVSISSGPRSRERTRSTNRRNPSPAAAQRLGDEPPLQRGPRSVHQMFHVKHMVERKVDPINRPTSIGDGRPSSACRVCGSRGQARSPLT
jgi:hypothetical protein